MQFIYRHIFLTLGFFFTAFAQIGLAQPVNFNYDYDSLVKQLPIEKLMREK